MTSEQREAAIERMYGPLPTDGVTRRDVAAALDALLSEFVVLHRDDVTEERKLVGGTPAPLWLGKGAGASGGRPHARLVTRWEPITNKERADG